MLLSLLISLPLVVCAIFSIELALVLRTQRNTPQCWLLVWCITTTILYGCHYVYFHHSTQILPVTVIIYGACNLAVYPLYLIYISELTDKEPISSRWWLLGVLLLPSGLAGIALAIAHGQPEAQEMIHRVCQIVFAIEVIMMLFFGIKKIKGYNQAIEQLYADTESRSMQSISRILQLLVATSLMSMVVNILGRNSFLDSHWIAIPSLAFSLLLFAIGWTGLKMRPTMRDMNISTGDSSSEQEETNEMQEKMNMIMLRKRLEQLMQQERIYLQQDLRLDQMAQILGTNRTYLLQMLRTEMGMSFKEYVNRMRINHAKELMRNNPEMQKTEVADLSGYNTLSSFYRNLKAYG